MKAYFESNRGILRFLKEKTYFGSTRKKLRFRNRKTVLEVRHGLRVILRETIWALLQINPTKGYGRSWTIGLNLEGERESPAGEEYRRGGAPLPAVRSSPERLVWVLEAMV